MRTLCALLLLTALAAGCASNWTTQHGTPEGLAKTAAESGEASAEYKIGPGDVLEVSVNGEESLNRKDLVVSPDGKISFPLIGDAQVGGLTTAQAKEALEKSLREYIPEAVAAVSVMQRGSLAKTADESGEASGDHKIRPGDVLEVSVYGEESLNREDLEVSPDGKISFPLIGIRDAQVVGLTTAQAKEALEKSLREYSPEPVVAVSVMLVGSLAKTADESGEASGGYKIRPGDVLEVSVQGQESLNRKDLEVSPDGKISFPLIGDAQVGGLTTAQAKEALEKSLREYIPEPVVAVSVMQPGSLAKTAAESGEAAGDYKIRPSDVLEVSVQGQESLNRKDLLVRPDGKISFPLIGDAQVGGLTTAQAKEALEKSLHEYIPEPVVAVSVMQPGSLAKTAAESGEAAGDYKIRPSDVLEVSVQGQESLNRKDLLVRPDGKISFPLIGDAQVGGLTTAQAKEALEKSLHEYIPEAVVAVSIMQPGSLAKTADESGEASGEYKIRPSDVLAVSVQGQESLNRKDLVVKPDGKISFPLIGDAQVGGLTTAQAKEALEKSLHEYIPEAVVAVSVMQPGSLAKTAAESGEAAGDYKMGPGDVLEVSVYGEESLNRKDLVVRPDGRISFPLIGDAKVGGLTTAQAKEVLEKSLHEYIPEAVAAISVMQLGSLQYYVVGKVNKPGMYNVSKPLTVLQALAMAGGLTPFAQESNILIMRNAGKDTVHIAFNYKKVKKGKNIEENIILERGDVVVVP